MNASKIRVGTSIVATSMVIGRLYRFIWPKQWSRILLVATLTVTLVFIPLASLWAQAELINSLIMRHGQDTGRRIIWLVVMITTSSLLISILNSLRAFAEKYLFSKVTEDLELCLMRKRSEIDVSVYETPEFNDLLGKLDEKGVWPAWNLIQEQFRQLANSLQMITAATVLSVFDWRLCLLAFGSAVPEFLVELRYGKSSWDIWDTDVESRRRYSSIRRHFTCLSGLAELSVFQNVSKFLHDASTLFCIHNQRQLQLDSKIFGWRLVGGGSSVVVQAMSFVIVVNLAYHDRIQLGTMTFLVASLFRFQTGLAGFFSSIARQCEWALYTSDMFKLLDTTIIKASHSNSVRLSCLKAPCIEFRNVSFVYPSSQTAVVHGINLTIASGERLALVGLNGAGKSTLIKLLLRFYDPTAGQILVDGHDLRDVNRDDWWACLGVLFQQFANYNFPVKQIIALGRQWETDSSAEVIEAAEMVDAHGFIMQLDGKYDQMIGKEFRGGVDLSWGQCQKLALSRAIVRKARILVLDEPTASIDAKAEAAIFARLEHDKSGQTQIIISHKFSTIRRADRICVMDNGTIVEVGTHSDLMESGQLYSRLYELQTLDAV